MVDDSRTLAIDPTASPLKFRERGTMAKEFGKIRCHRPSTEKKEETRLYIHHTHIKIEHIQTKLDRQTSIMDKILSERFNVLISH